jgi:hypothetical protein
VIRAIGLSLIVIFILLRVSRIYGDPLLWSEQKNFFYTILSFINTQKYPPSFLYLCMTIGPSLVFLSLISKARNGLSKVIIVFGRVPFFYYILHFYILHIISAIAFLLRGHSFRDGAKGAEGLLFKFMIPGEGFSLMMVYVFWIAVVIALYPLCKWYSNYKSRHRKWWLSYL